ncbi:hypothetical protein GALMADRAFT_1328691 [Galerina marginata CBS 339.88]|uniref:CHAT domain-containing protein n=1 Tax=Galerina marginata (strain CBS 339.88) TaxID=685588 RepID=A0A067T0S4_GALM3|nr:hypothetical protein GALMADRAFT_1328691 [Galerina marginata CBS 339.88]
MNVAALAQSVISDLRCAAEFICRFEDTGSVEDITQAIEHMESVVSSVIIENFGELSNALGRLYALRFECTVNVQDIDCAISHHQNAVESTPSGHADLPSRFNNLGNAYSGRFKCTGDLKDINSAISHQQKAVESTPSGYAGLSSRINDLGNSYLRRFEHTGDLKDISSAISHHQKAVESTPSGHADLLSGISNLGSSYMRRFNHTGDLKDINSAISHHQKAKAVEFTPSGHADLPRGFSNLGTSYLVRFERTGDLNDVNSALSYHQKAMESTASGHADLSSRFNNLGSSYNCRFQCTGELKDVDSAISHHQKAIESTPSGHACLPTRFNNLGNAYSGRFERTGDLKDINSAISHHQKAVECTPSGHACLPTWFNNLGNSYAFRFKRTADLEDIDSAISHHLKAVEFTPSGHSDLPGRFKNLGNSYSCRFKHNQYFPDIECSIGSYRGGAASNGAPSIRLQSAKLAARLSSIHDCSHCLIDFSLAITLLSEVAGLEQTVHRRHANLLDHSQFLGLAVANALILGRPDSALEWLEQGRCLVWNQINQLRTPVDTLRMNHRHRSLADRFIEVAKALESHGTRSNPSSSGTLAEEIRLQDDTLIHTGLAADYRKLIEEIRSLPDFNDFLRPPKVVDLLASLPSDSPVIIFNIHEDGCDALALMAGLDEPLHIPLKDFSLAEAEKLKHALQVDLLKQREVKDQDRGVRIVSENRISMAGILQALWYKVVQPILEALGYSFWANDSTRRRIWWCPTGPLAFLPLHAAGIYGSSYKPGLRVSDFAVSSYTPTVQFLNKKSAASSTVQKCTNILLINPNTPSLPAIPFTRKEVHNLKVIMDNPHIRTLLLEDGAATTDKVKAEMNTCNWVHFACHGIQDVGDPLKSGVHLRDGRLELLEIMRQKLSNPEFAFLSACQTSKGDLKLSEEVVHLAAGMLAAGYRGVVGTMWSISDRHGPEFAKWFYEYLLENMGTDGLDSTKAAYALDYATRKVRDTLGEDDDAFLTWVPYVHFGY